MKIPFYFSVKVCFLLIVVNFSFAESNAVNATKSTGQWYKHAGSAMGTSITIEFWHHNQQVANALIQRVMAEMKRVDQLMSPYIASSELSQINETASVRPVIVSQELFDLIALSLRHGQWSGGVFDITYASVGRFYNYRKSIKPENNAIEQALPLVDYRAVTLNPSARSVAFEKEGTKIDLGGIAKGHAVDSAILYLHRHGVRHATVSAGGDSRILGDRRGRPWMMGIKDPRGEGHIVSLPLQDLSVSTSGDYERYFIDQSGIRHHHILNPKDGLSASLVRSVTILGPNATMTDALSTTVFVMGVKKGLNYINGIADVSAIIIDGEGKLHYSNDLVRPERQ